MIKRILSVLLALPVLCAVISGCSININLDASNLSDETDKTVSKIINDLESELDNIKQSSAGDNDKSEGSSASYSMADVKKLKNTENFAKNTLEHIFDGTINGKGKATGYHYTLISDSKGEVIEGTQSKKDEHGVFTGKVKVSGVKKDGFSSFYPESWTPQQVVDAINEAYDDALGDSSNPHGSLWIGYSGDLEIDMYLNDSKKITTAYPIYEGD